MLSAAKTDLVRRDTAIPGLATLLDPEAFIAAFQPFVPEIVFSGVRPTYLRYKPGTNCLSAYRLDTDVGCLDVYAKAHGPDALVNLAKAGHLKTAPGTRHAGLFVLEDRGMVVWFFPNDGKLRQLRRLAKPEARRNLFRQFLPAGIDASTAALETLAYKPERRYVARLVAAAGPQAVVKFHTPYAFRRVRVSTGAFAQSGPLRVPRCIGVAEESGAIGFEWFPGRLLSEIVAEPDHDAAALLETGAALAELHAQEPLNLAVRTRAAEAEALNAIARWMSFVSPRLADRAVNLASRLAGWLLAEPAHSRPIHGDFYAKQVLVSAGGVGLLDLDEAVRSDPRADLGLFVAHLERDVVRGRVPAGSVGLIAETLLDGYRRAAGRLSENGLGWYVAIGLFQLLHGPFRTCEPDWEARTETLLARVERILTPSSPPSSVQSKPETGIETRYARTIPSTRVLDSKMPFLRRALDPKEAECALRRMLQSTTNREEEIRLLGMRVLRHKPGRRCLVQYDVGIRDGDRPWKRMSLLGKARARGLDTKTYRLYEALRRAGLRSGGSGRVAIPRPLGVIPEFQMWFQQKVQGAPATGLLERAGGVLLACRIAEAIHRLHQAGISAGRRHRIADELRILRERLACVVNERPSWKGRIDRLLEACQRLGGSIRGSEMVGIHRDFYPDQVIVDGARLYLVDLDLYAEGDPALDIGNFVAHLKEQALRLTGNPHALADCEEALVQRFLALSGRTDRFSVEAYVTLTLARLVFISTLIPDRRPYTLDLLALCEERLGTRSAGYALPRAADIRA